MKLLRIAVKDFIQNMRDINVMMIMTAFPIILIFLVGAAFSNYADGDIFQVNNIKIHVIKSSDLPETVLNFEKVIKALESSMDIETTINTSSNLEQSIDALSRNRIDMIIEIDSDALILHKNEVYHKQYTIIEVLLESYFFVEQDQLSKTQPIDSVKVNIIPSANHQSLLDYYGIAFMILFMVYGISNSITNTISEKKSGNTDRVLMSPISVLDLVLGKILGHTLVNVVQVCIVFVTTIVIFNVNWGDNPIVFVPVIVTFVMMIVSFGTFMGFVFNSEGISLAIIHTLIVVFAFFGGSYMSLEGIGWLGSVGKYFSPIWWITKGIIDGIYFHDFSTMIQATIMNVLLATIFICLTWLIIRKKEVLS